MCCILHVAVQITIAYVDPGATRQQQREALCEMYFFDQEAVPSSTDDVLPSTAGSSTGHVLPPGHYMRLRPEPLASLTVDLAQQQQPAWSLPGFGSTKPYGSSFMASLRDNMLGAQSRNNNGPGGLGGSAAASTPQLQVKVYGLRPSPPWPTGKADGQLTQVLVRGLPGGASAGAGGVQQVGRDFIVEG
jgi:hypothetical protein